MWEPNYELFACGNIYQDIYYVLYTHTHHTPKR